MLSRTLINVSTSLTPLALEFLLAAFSIPSSADYFKYFKGVEPLQI